MRLASAVAFMFLVLVFFTCFYCMLYMMWYALQVIRPPEEVCEAPLCSIYQSVREGVKRIFVFTAVMLLLAFIVSIVVLWIEQRLWEDRLGVCK